MLTFELTKAGDELDVHFDDEGLALLKGILENVQQKRAHEHLMTPSWGGSELTEDKQGPDSTLLNKVTLHIWR
jgi:hypothetical protein